MAASITINGVEMIEPSSIDVSRNKIWSSGSGRTQSGKFTGDIKARKWKLDIVWKVLTKQETKDILAALEPAFINVKFLNPRTNTFETRVFYAGDEAMPVYSYELDGITYESLKVALVEQ